jgi:DNA-binding response OmpR family regulator
VDGVKSEKAVVEAEARAVLTEFEESMTRLDAVCRTSQVGACAANAWTRGGEKIAVTAKEFKTLKFLTKNTERPIPRGELLNEVWGYQNYPCTRTVDNHILRLRQKLESDPSNPSHFLTVHRVG